MAFPLNPAQAEAVRRTDVPMLVLAGAGSGKTRVITAKIAHLVATGTDPSRVVAITFTNKAAREMRERANALLAAAGRRDDAAKVRIATFHALGLSIVRAESKALGLKPGFSVLDPQDLESIVAELVATADRSRTRKAQWKISQWKNALATPAEALRAAKDDDEAVAAKAYAHYADALAAYQAVDFDDLIRLPVELLERDAEARARWQARSEHVLVDEYQDTNPAQYRLFRALVGERARFTAVGDDDQAIYGWRGADIDNLRKLPAEFPNLKVIKLKQNYRSTMRILKAANNVIANNEKLFDKKLWSEHGHGEQISVTTYRDNDAEAEGVVMKLQAHRFEQRTQFKDYAILYCSNHQARIFEEYLRDHRIPYLLSGGKSFFDKAEIKDIIAYLRLLANEDDDPAYIRAATTPKRGIGAATLQVLGTYAGERHVSLFAAAFEEGFAHRVAPRQLEPLLEFGQFINRMQERAGRESANLVLPDLLKAIDYETYLYDHEEERVAQTRWANVCEFANWINKKGELDGKTLIELTQSIALINMLDKQNDEEVDAVQLLTLHAS